MDVPKDQISTLLDHGLSISAQFLVTSLFLSLSLLLLLLPLFAGPLANVARLGWTSIRARFWSLPPPPMPKPTPTSKPRTWSDLDPSFCPLSLSLAVLQGHLSVGSCCFPLWGSFECGLSFAFLLLLLFPAAGAARRCLAS